MTDKIMVATRSDDRSEVVPVEVDVLKRHGEWALVQHGAGTMPEPHATVTHVPSGLALVSVYGFEIESTKQLLWMLPASPVGLPCMLPQTIEDSDELRSSAELAPCVGEIKAWVRMWKEAVNR